MRAIRALLPHESFLYLGDTARVPYGNKSAATVVRYSLENAAFLMRHHVKAIVVACNTSSALALKDLTQAVAVPIIGMIAPGAARAVAMSRHQRIGIIGTTATIASRAYEHAIHALAPGTTVDSVACPLFVPLVEEGWLDTPATTMIAGQYLEALPSRDLDTLILGCTHYPLLQQVIHRILPRSLPLIDTGEAAAAELHQVLASADLLAPPATLARDRICVTDATPHLPRIAEQLFAAPLSPAEIVSVD